MTESSWLNACDPSSMLQFIHKMDNQWTNKFLRWIGRRPKLLTARKIRLIFCAAWREIIRIRQTELDGPTQAFLLSNEDEADLENDETGWELGSRAHLRNGRIIPVGGWPDEEEAVCHVIRDIIGNPFSVVTFHPPQEMPKRAIVRAMARAIYESRTFEDMPILADLLEEAGCPNSPLLEHFRAVGVHFRGCWALDLVRSN